ncbi:MAG: NAD(P)/FAD-dependent oxidoreductase [Desulfobacteraceae bacterium]|nr:MAG: NAD(P)/FAD-dependent oxidoreductase [Desulfobacteraceae bacterium]
MKKILIIGGGFAGLTAAKGLGNLKDAEVTLIDRSNYHLFQPLLYQVAMAGLSPAEIAVPLRSILSKYKNIRILQGEALSVAPDEKVVTTTIGRFDYDTLILACGALHAYFGNEHWEADAPGLKTLEQATEIRRRVLSAFEKAEAESDPEEKSRHLTFIIVGGGPTGVELAGALGELSRHTLAQDFKNIDPTLARVILIESGPRILPSFSEPIARKAARSLEHLGVEIWTAKRVTCVDDTGIEMGQEKLPAATVIWAAGIRAARLLTGLDVKTDAQGRVLVSPDLSLEEHPEIFVAGDQAGLSDDQGNPLPGIAPVAQQQGEYLARTIRGNIEGKPGKPFHYADRGQLATIGRSRAVLEYGWLKLSGFPAWFLWVIIHIYFLIGFQNRLFVILRWASSYLSFRRGARLVVNKSWRSYPDGDAVPPGHTKSYNRNGS